MSGIPGNKQVKVSFSAPSSDGGAAITGYTVTASPGGNTATGASSPLVITGLLNGTPYTFTVKATNSNGMGAPSAFVRRSVTPRSHVLDVARISGSSPCSSPPPLHRAVVARSTGSAALAFATGTLNSGGAFVLPGDARLGHEFAASGDYLVLVTFTARGAGSVRAESRVVIQ